MTRLRSANRICSNMIKKALCSPRIYVAFLWVGFLLYGFSEKIKLFSNITGIAVSPWTFPFFTMETGSQIFIILGALLIFCDAPFLTQYSYIQLIRSGRKTWFWGTLFYIFSLSFIYVIGLFLLSVLFLLPRVELMVGWGKIIGTLAQTNAGATIGFAQLDYSIIANFKPIQAVLLTLAAVWMNCVLLGLLVYAFNLCVKKGAGIIIGAILALSPLLIVRLVQERLAYYLAPPVWMNLSIYNWDGYGYHPSEYYIYGILGIGIIICTLVIYLGIWKKDINTSEEF